MRKGREWAMLGRDVFMANGVFKRRVLRPRLSGLDEMLYRHTLGDEDRSCVGPMFVIIMRADIC